MISCGIIISPKLLRHGIWCLLPTNNYCKFYYSSMWSCCVLFGPILKAQLATLRLHRSMKCLHCPHLKSAASRDNPAHKQTQTNVREYYVRVFTTVRPVHEYCLHCAALERMGRSLKHTATAKRQILYHIKLLQTRKTNVNKLLSNYLQMTPCGWWVFANGYR